MELTTIQKQFFYDHGYVQIPGVIPPVMVNAALQAINHSIGEGMDPAKMPTFRAQSYCPEITRTPVITDLFNKTPAFPLVESLIGEGKISLIQGGQIALRFPQFQDPPKPPVPHLDGMYTPTNGVPKGQILNFTALVGVYLSDVPQPYAGNFTVWPGTHHIYERYFRERGPESLLEGMPPVGIPEPQQITGRAGDVMIVHYMLGHTAAVNISPHIRYAIFFRLEHVEHARHKWESMTDIWLEWEGMRQIVTRQRDTEEIR